MTDLVARTGRHQQRYDAGFRLVAGCIPFRYAGGCGVQSNEIIEVLMINSQTRPGLLFPKGGWENDETDEQAAVREAYEEAGVKGNLMGFLGDYDFKSKTRWDEFSPDGSCRARMFALLVKEELDTWPEQMTRRRHWLSIPEAIQHCRHPWMCKALKEGFDKWHREHLSGSNKRDPGSRAD